MQKVLATSLLFAATAFALPAAASPFVTTSRIDGDTQGGIEASYVNDSNTDLSLRFDAYAQYAIPSSSNVSVFAEIPFSYASGSNGNGLSATGIGELQLGAAARSQINPDVKLIVSFGVGLPTASDSLDRSESNLFAFSSRLTDLLLDGSNLVLLRPTITGLYHHDKMYAQADFGVDAAIATGSRQGNPDPFIRFNAAIGADLGPAVVSAEYSLLYTTDSTIAASNSFVQSIAIGARSTSGPLSPYVAVVIPLDSTLRDSTTGFGMSFAVTAGLAYRPSAQ